MGGARDLHYDTMIIILNRILYLQKTNSWTAEETLRGPQPVSWPSSRSLELLSGIQLTNFIFRCLVYNILED